MSRKKFPSDVLAQAQEVLVGWSQISSTLAFGPVTQITLMGDISNVGSLELEISKLEIQLADKKNQREQAYLGMWDKVKRARAGVKANYGDDSQQFEMVGGTRSSERKSPRRSVATS